MKGIIEFTHLYLSILKNKCIMPHFFLGGGGGKLDDVSFCAKVLLFTSLWICFPMHFLHNYTEIKYVLKLNLSCLEIIFSS